MDSIQIILKTGTDSENAGGTVIDSPVVVLPDGHLDLILNSFKDAYGLASLENDENNTPILLNEARNFSYRIRMYVQEIFAAYSKKLKRLEAEEIANTQIQASLGSIVVK